MRDTLAFEILSSMMADDWRADSPIPTTSNSNDLDPIIRLDGSELCVDPVIQEMTLGPQEVTLDPSYEETIQSLYSEDSQSDPLWTSTSTSITHSASTSQDGGDIDFLSDDSFMDASMTDVKGGLKSRIKAKRLASGQEELSLPEFKKVSKQEEKEMDEEELKLYHERKEKNRLAAQKCRNKKRERCDTLENDIDRLETRQDRLKTEIQRLEDERQHLEEVIQIHGVVCPKIRKISDS